MTIIQLTKAQRAYKTGMEHADILAWRNGYCHDQRSNRHMKYRVRGRRLVHAIDTCELVIEAESETAAIEYARAHAHWECERPAGEDAPTWTIDSDLIC